MSEESNLPAPPATPAEAAARLDGLMADPKWASKMLSGNGPEVRELHDLVAKKSSGDKIDQIIAGTVEPPIFETLHEGQLSTRNVMTSVADLREIGLTDAVIRQAIEGKPVPRAEYAAVKRLHADRLANAEWTAKLLKGGAVERRELTLMQIVLACGYQDGATA